MNLKKLQNLPNIKIGKALYLAQLFEGYNIIPPRFIVIVLTYRCNLNCYFCYQSKEKGKTFPDMNIDDAKILEENISKSFYFKPRIHLFGGEPTINKDFVEILKYFSEKGYKTSLTTNGINMNKYGNILAAIKGLKEINISLNVNDYRQVISSLQFFDGYDRDNKTIINLSCPINNSNQSNLIEIVREFENSHASCVTFQHAMFPFNYKDNMNIESIREQVELIRENKFRIPVLFLPDIKTKDIEVYYNDPDFPYNKNNCIFPWFSLIIEPNGNVIPCEEVDAVVGNAKNVSLKDIWNNGEYKRFRQNIRKQGISYPICKRCCHRQYY